MKKVALGIMAIAISFASIAQSSTEQKDHRGGDRKEFRDRGEKRFEKLNLTDAQKSQIKTLNEDFRNKMKSFGSDKSLSSDAQKQRWETLRTEHKNQLMSILTPDQRKQWEEQRKNHEFKGKDGKKFDRSKRDQKESV